MPGSRNTTINIFAHFCCLLGLTVLLPAGASLADETTVNAQFRTRVADRLQQTADLADKHLFRSAVGVTRHETPIPCLIARNDLDYQSKVPRILLVGGLDGSPTSVDATLQFLRWFHTDTAATELRSQFTLSAVPIANPDGWAAGSGLKNQSGGTPTTGYPPVGKAYLSTTDPESAYLWRWVGMHAPDLIIDIRTGDRLELALPAGLDERLQSLSSNFAVGASPGEFVSALQKHKPSDVGTIPAVELRISNADTAPFQKLLHSLVKIGYRKPSPARREIQRRLDRSPLQIAQQLGQRYGHQLNSVVYIPALALIGRLRVGELTTDPSQLADVERIVAPYIDGSKESLPENPSGSHQSGHLVFAELARRTGKSAYIDRVRAAADLGFDADGQPRASMPSHVEMSDSVFMGCPILAEAGALTGENRYFDMALTHFRFIRNLDLRPDGIYRNSPLNDAAWGRGNGFPALGLALSLSRIPKDHPAFAEMTTHLKAHLDALIKHQDITGTWHQVIDHPESYRELTSTCMITFAMIRGIRSGYLDADTYRPAIEKAWPAIRTRIATDGTLVDVCTGTGKQTSLRGYLDRMAILGADDRGGAMSLMVSTELATWELKRQAKQNEQSESKIDD